MPPSHVKASVLLLQEQGCDQLGCVIVYVCVVQIPQIQKIIDLATGRTHPPWLDL